MGRAFKKARTPIDEVALKAADIGMPVEQLARGSHEIVDVRLDDGERVMTHRTLMNRGGSAIERWLNEPNSKLFGEPEIAAIRYCQALWARIDRKGPPDMSGIRKNLWMGQSEHEALSEISQIKGKFPPRMWSCFENICRFDLDAPSAGATLATNARSASDGAKTCVAFVAGMIAQWRGM